MIKRLNWRDWVVREAYCEPRAIHSSPLPLAIAQPASDFLNPKYSPSTRIQTHTRLWSLPVSLQHISSAAIASSPLVHPYEAWMCGSYRYTVEKNSPKVSYIKMQWKLWNLQAKEGGHILQIIELEINPWLSFTPVRPAISEDVWS